MAGSTNTEGLAVFCRRDAPVGRTERLHELARLCAERLQGRPELLPARCPVADHWIDDQDPNVSSEPADDASWWQTFNDPVLDSLVQTAYRQNLSLRIAGLRFSKPAPSGASLLESCSRNRSRPLATTCGRT